MKYKIQNEIIDLLRSKGIEYKENEKYNCIYIDSQSISDKTPEFKIQISAERHHVEIKFYGFKSYDEKSLISAIRKVNLKIQLYKMEYPKYAPFELKTDDNKSAYLKSEYVMGEERANNILYYITQGLSIAREVYDLM